MNNPSFAEFEESALDTLYLRGDRKKVLTDLGFGFREEFTELLHYDDPVIDKKLREMFWGIKPEDETADAIKHDRILETGDVMYYLVVTGILKGLPLQQVARESARIFSGRQVDISNFSDLAELTNLPIPSTITPGYPPDYKQWMYNDMPRFAEKPEQTDSQPTETLGPIADTFYTLLASRRIYDRIMYDENMKDIDPRMLLRESALILGALSITMQGRFDFGLEVAATENIKKRERRAKEGTLATGTDKDRSQPDKTSRPQLDTEQVNRIIVG